MHLTQSSPCIIERALQHQRSSTPNAMATFPDDCLPPEGFFESRQALFESINAYAKPRGYAFIIQRSIREKNGL